MSNIVVDDTDPSLTYSGQWNLFVGSSRQWDSTIHSTFQSGATVSFQFKGSVCRVYGTVPAGNGSTILMDVTIDGSVSPTVSRTSSSAADYANLFYQSSTMESGLWHTVVITNRGGIGNLDFEFDRVQVDASDIEPVVASFAPAAAASPQTLPSGTSSTLLQTSLNPTGAVAGATNTLSGVYSGSQPSKVSTQSMTVPSISPSVLTQFVTTTRQDGSVATSITEVTFFPNATSQASSNSAHTIPVSTIVGIVGGIVALLILLLLLIFGLRRWKAKNHRFALMGVSSDNATQNTTVAAPFTLAPSSPSSADLNPALDSPPPLTVMSEKALRQQTRANRSENNLEAASTPALFSPSHTTAPSVSTPSTHATGSISNVESLTLLKRPLSDLSPSSESPATSPPVTSTSIADPSTSGYGGITSMYDVPPAYRPN